MGNVIIRVGIIGTGIHGSRYASHIVNDLEDRFALAGISRRSEQGAAQAEAWGTRWHRDWRELVSDVGIDAIISATTPNLNRDIGLLCAQLGKPLLLEKPMATDYGEAREMVRCFKERGVSLTIGQTQRYNSIVCGLRERLTGMGRLFGFSACHRLEPSNLGWLEDPEVAGGGVIFHTAVHLFDALRFITGREFVRVRASRARICNPRLEDWLVAEIVMDDEVSGVVDASKVGPARVCRYEFVCENGVLQGDHIHGMLSKIREATIKPVEVEPPGPTLPPLLRDWHSHLSGRAENPIPGTEGLAAVKICHACREAARTGGWVELAALDERSSKHAESN